MTCLRAVALGQHDHRPAGGLELLDVGVHAAGRGRPERARGVALGRLGRPGVVDGVVLAGTAASASPASRRSLILAWAMSRATTIGPVSESRVFTGYCDSSARISSIGRLRSMCTDVGSRGRSSVTSGRKRAGSVRAARGTRRPAVILPSAWRSAEHDTAMPDRARRAVAGQADHPHVVAEVLAAELGADAGRLGQLRAPAAPARGRGSAWPSLDARRSAARRGSGPMASLAVLTANSADVPPITMARWYGGQAAVPSDLHLLEDHGSSDRRVQQRLGLLEQVALVGRAAALGHEQELVVVAVDRRRSRSGPAGWCRCSSRRTCQGRHLRVAQVRRLVGVVDARGRAPPRRRRR